MFDGKKCRPKSCEDVRSLARSHSTLAVNTLIGIAKSPKCPPAARVGAATALLDRGWGRPSQAITGEDGGELRITIRQIIDCAQTKTEPDGEPSGES